MESSPESVACELALFLLGGELLAQIDTSECIRQIEPEGLGLSRRSSRTRSVTIVLLSLEHDTIGHFYTSSTC